MGYRIIYAQEPLAPEKPRGTKLKMMTAAFALALVVLVRLFWPQGTQMLQNALLPGDHSHLDQLTRDIRAGEPVGEAVTAFCQSIIEEALAQTD